MNSTDVKSFLCPITNSLMEEPVIAMDGHSYERKAFEGWLKRGHNVSPKTMQPLQSTAYIPNLALKEAIEAFKARHPEDLTLEIALARKELELAGANTPGNQSLSRTSSGNSTYFPERSPGTQQSSHYEFPVSPTYHHAPPPGSYGHTQQSYGSSSAAYTPPLPPITEKPRRPGRGTGPGPNGMTVEQTAKAIQHGDADPRLTHFMNWCQISGNTLPPQTADRYGRQHDLQPRPSKVSLSSKPRVWNSITRKDSWALGPEPESMRKSSFRNESNLQLKQTRSADALADELRKSFVLSEGSDLSGDEDLMGKVMREARSSLAAARLVELDLDYIPPPPPDSPPPLDPPPPPRNQLATTHTVNVKKLSSTGVSSKQGFLNQSLTNRASEPGSPDDTIMPPPGPPPPESPPKPTHHSSLSGVFGQPKPAEKPVPLPSQLPRPSSHSVMGGQSPLAGSAASAEGQPMRTMSEAVLPTARSSSISLVRGAGGRMVREKVFSNGDKYVGEWDRDKMNGQGRYLFAKDNSSYEGEFLDGRMNGYGIYIDKDGGRFEGYYQQGRKHGMGTYVYHNDATYEGEWAYDKKHGKGKLTFPNGDIYTGDFVDNKFCGRGHFRSAKGDVYEGEYNNSKKNGQGTQTFAAGGSYSGEWQDNKKHGQGTCVYANGARYEGGWEDNLRHGYGIYTFATGPRYEGEWVADKMHGRGTLYKPNGTKEEGEYRHNRLLLPGESKTSA